MGSKLTCEKKNWLSCLSGDAKAGLQRIVSLLVLLVFFSPISLTAQNQTAAQGNVIFILFDPTILEGGDSNGLSVLMNELRNFYVKIPENTWVSVLIVEPGMIHKSPIYDRFFEFRREFGGGNLHQNALEKSFDELWPKLRERWNTEQESQKSPKPTSCIFSALHAVQRHINAYSSSKGHYDFYLLVISDMLESCSEWGSLINFERSVGELQKVDTEKITVNIDLSKIKKAIFIQVPHRKIVTPLENTQLEDFWKKFLSKVKIRSDNLYYGSRFPINPPWSK